MDPSLRDFVEPFLFRETESPVREVGLRLRNRIKIEVFEDVIQYVSSEIHHSTGPQAPRGIHHAIRAGR